LADNGGGGTSVLGAALDQEPTLVPIRDHNRTFAVDHSRSLRCGHALRPSSGLPRFPNERPAEHANAAVLSGTDPTEVEQKVEMSRNTRRLRPINAVRFSFGPPTARSRPHPGWRCRRVPPAAAIIKITIELNRCGGASPTWVRSSRSQRLVVPAHASLL